MNPVARTFLRPFSCLFGGAVAVKNKLYETGVLSSRRANVPIVSVGNLTMGGTGKTPLIAGLVQWARQQGLKVGVVSRGYGGKGPRPAEVRLGVAAAQTVFGDEAVMLKQRFPEVPVYVGPKRIEAVELLLKDHPTVQVIFADDAFQHRQLARDLDIVVIDCMKPLSEYSLIPAGRARESFASLRRAQFVILNKCNLAAPELKQQMLAHLEDILENSDGAEIIESDFYIFGFKDLAGQDVELPKNQKILLVSAVGNPASVEKLARLHGRVVKHLIYQDHHKFTAADAKAIMAHKEKQGADVILVTEKDAVKLAAFADRLDGVFVSVLEPKLSLKVKKLYERILGLLH